MNNYTKHLELEQKLIEMEETIEKLQSKEETSCGNCGKLIEDYEDVEYKEDEVILTYRCACGAYAEQYYKLVYNGTKVIE